MLNTSKLLVLSCLLFLVACSSSNSTVTDEDTNESTGAAVTDQNSDPDSTTNENSTTESNSTNSPIDENTDTPDNENTSETTDGSTDTSTDGNTGASTDGGADTSPDGNTDTTDVVTQPPVTSANYRITFNGTWSAQTHATMFPANAHFSGLVGAVHNDQVVFWEAGQIASNGIELMAETGAKSLFLDEINSAIDSGYAQSAIDGAGIATAPGSVSVEISVSLDNPKVTITTMLAPSPDWFTGFHDVSLHDGESFVESVTIEGFVYDSGTDSGPQYTSGNSDTQPREVIRRLTSESSDSPFVEGLPVAGQFVIERL